MYLWKASEDSLSMDLRVVDLNGDIQRKADFSGPSVKHADLRYADLGGVNIKVVFLSAAQTSQAKW